ncbi:nuclear transport factor 2 family protein [Nocardioides currus]|uniref:nuclear transport factor 2 family protein n=1 Tax=Nocardioides currus TaxID=2133958 RepID=UPI0014038E7F|nr:nuclear transport factor 2 family protein [Nocardioides currus]
MWPDDVDLDSVASLRHREVARAIASVKRAYFRHLDAKDWPALEAMFAPGSSLRHPVLGAFDDIACAIDAVRHRIGASRTTHEGRCTSITLHAPDTAEATFDMTSVRWLADGRRVRTAGEYRDVLVRDERGWRIASLVLTSSYREQ